jgi:hypothetical protein
MNSPARSMSSNESSRFRTVSEFLGEMFAKCRVYTAGLAESNLMFREERLSCVKHRVVRPPRRKIDIAAIKKTLRRSDGAISFVEESGGILVQAGTASLRTA